MLKFRTHGVQCHHKTACTLPGKEEDQLMWLAVENWIVFIMFAKMDLKVADYFVYVLFPCFEYDLTVTRNIDIVNLIVKLPEIRRQVGRKMYTGLHATLPSKK